MCGFFSAVDRTVCGLPGLQSAVEHGHLVMAHPLQHPPQAAAVVGAVAVVDHGLHVIGQADAGEPDGKFFAIRQRVASARCRGIGTGGGNHAVGARHAVPGAQRAVQVGVNGAGNVRLQVLLLAGLGQHQVKAAVKHAARLAAGQQGLQLLGGNQGGVAHVMLLRSRLSALQRARWARRGRAARWQQLRW